MLDVDMRAVLCTMLLVALVPLSCQGASFGMSDWSLVLDEGDTETAGTSVHHFARYGLCKDMVGKMRFFSAISEHLCGLSDNLKVGLVLDLCSRKDHVLDQWVAQIYDSDGDGYISHSERTFYKD